MLTWMLLCTMDTVGINHKVICNVEYNSKWCTPQRTCICDYNQIKLFIMKDHSRYSLMFPLLILLLNIRSTLLSILHFSFRPTLNFLNFYFMKTACSVSLIVKTPFAPLDILIVNKTENCTLVCVVLMQSCILYPVLMNESLNPQK